MGRLHGGEGPIERRPLLEEFYHDARQRPHPCVGLIPGSIRRASTVLRWPGAYSSERSGGTPPHRGHRLWSSNVEAAGRGGDRLRELGHRDWVCDPQSQRNLDLWVADTPLRRRRMPGTPSRAAKRTTPSSPADENGMKRVMDQHTGQAATEASDLHARAEKVLERLRRLSSPIVLG